MSENQAEAFQRIAKVPRFPGAGIMMGLFMEAPLRCESSRCQGGCRQHVQAGEPRVQLHLSLFIKAKYASGFCPGADTFISSGGEGREAQS